MEAGLRLRNLSSNHFRLTGRGDYRPTEATRRDVDRRVHRAGALLEAIIALGRRTRHYAAGSIAGIVAATR